MTLLAIALLALVDGALSGFRASLGRTGLVGHRRDDLAGVRRGLVLVILLALPALVVAGLDVAALGGTTATYVAAGRVFLLILSPYVAVMLLALAVYGVLRWELKYLASAMILGPFTFLRPYVATVAVVVAVIRDPSPALSVSALLALAAVLLVEPSYNRCCQRRPRRQGACGDLVTVAARKSDEQREMAT